MTRATLLGLFVNLISEPVQFCSELACSYFQFPHLIDIVEWYHAAEFYTISYICPDKMILGRVWIIHWSFVSKSSHIVAGAGNVCIIMKLVVTFFSYETSILLQ